MFEDLSLHILDIAENSVNAGATVVGISIEEDRAADRLTIQVVDNGRGMDEDFLAKIQDPFVTTRQTRRVGLGIPFLAQSARLAGGDLTIESEPQRGTTLQVTFELSHIDRQPLGDVPETMVTLIVGNPGVEFYYSHTRDGEERVFDTTQSRSEAAGTGLWTASELRELRHRLRETGFIDEH